MNDLQKRWKELTNEMKKTPQYKWIAFWDTVEIRIFRLCVKLGIRKENPANLKER